jgi:ATP-dependent DNA ligase
MVFDVLWLDGEDLTSRTYLERPEVLAETVKPGDGWLVPAHHVDGAADLFEAAQEQGLGFS